MSPIFSVWTFEILGIKNVILQELCDGVVVYPPQTNDKKMKPLWKASTRFHLFLNQWKAFVVSTFSSNSFSAALLEADMFRHVLPGNNNACLICHEIMKRDLAGYLTGCRLMVWFNCRFYSFPHSQPFMLHQIKHQVNKWQKLQIFHDQL